MKIAALKKKKGFTLIELMVVIAILASLAAIGYGPIIDHMNDGDRQMAQSNLKSTYTILQGFKTDRGAYPNDNTAESLQEKMMEEGMDVGTMTGETSNAYFRQLFANKSGVSEKTFFAKLNCAGKTVVEEGDNRYANGKALMKGENAMGYVMKRNKNGDDPNLKMSVQKSSDPLAICGVYPSTTPYSGTEVAYDRSSFRGHVFMLSCDGSVKDLEKNLVSDEGDDDKAFIAKDKNIFPESDRGANRDDNYIVLSPEL